MPYILTNDHWVALRPLVQRAKRNRQGLTPNRPVRGFLKASLDIARTGVPWRYLPGAFGRWVTVDNRFRRRVAPGSREALFGLLAADPQFGEVRRVIIDSTIARAQPHGAGPGGGRKDRPGRRSSAAASAG